jgi:hypothetical protein
MVEATIPLGLPGTLVIEPREPRATRSASTPRGYNRVMSPVQLVIATLAAAVGASPTFDPYEGQRPIAVWVQTNPWLWVIGSDSPRAVLYEDGELVFAKVRGRRDVVFRHSKLGPAQLNAFKVRIAAAAGLSDVRGHYELSELTDQPETLLYARSGEREVATRIYGLADEDVNLPASEVRPVPKELHELHRLLATVADVGSTDWQPRYVEVMLAPQPQAVGAAHWPSDWPGIKSDHTFARPDGQYSIYLDGRLKPKLDALLAQQKDRSGIELGGSIWAMRPRMVFPSEPIWSDAFRSAAAR